MELRLCLSLVLVVMDFFHWSADFLWYPSGGI